MVGCIEQTNHNPGLFNFSYESIIIMIYCFGTKKTKTSANLWQRSEKMLFPIKLCDGIWAELSTLTGFAMLAYPYFIELIHGLFYDFLIIS